MKKHSAENERIKRRYFSYLKEAKRYSEDSVDEVSKALNRFEVYTKYRDFKAFHFEQAIAFKKHLADQKGQRSGERLSKATLHKALNQLKGFFHWLAGQPGYRSRLQYTDAEYFNLSEKDTRIATAKRVQKAPTLEQIKHVISMMPRTNDIERRNRAVFAFTIVTGARVGAIASMKLKHIDLKANCIIQDAREVNTKFSKTFNTYFFPVGDELRCIVEEWVTHLREEKLWGNNDPLFPSTLTLLGKSRKFEAIGLTREHWRTTRPICNIFREAFTKANVAYFNPHSFRNTLATLGEEICTSPEEFKAWSQNIGHEKVLTTFNSYGTVALSRQAEIITRLATPKEKEQVGANQIAETLFKMLKESGVGIDKE